MERVNVEISKPELRQPEGMIGMQDRSELEKDDSSAQNVGVETPFELIKATNISTGTMKNEQSCGFQMEKPKFPKFSGDVRDYVIFRADFKHTIESRYIKRDAITLLQTKTCFKDKPLELIQGIGSDTITQDIAQFRALQEEEDARFCDLVHLVKRPTTR